MRVRVHWAGLIAALAVTVAASARAQDEELKPLPTPVTVIPLERPSFTATVRGDFGVQRITGVLDEAPREALRLSSGQEVGWAQVRSLSVTSYPTEGLPVGSLTLGLVSDDLPYQQSVGSTRYRDYSSAPNPYRVQKMPSGRLVLRGEPYGSFPVPLERLQTLSIEPVRGGLVGIPQGDVKLELFSGVTVALPIQDVETFRRDVGKGVATVVMLDGQQFVGKLAEIPNTTVTVETTRGRMALRLNELAIYERVPPGGRRL